MDNLYVVEDGIPRRAEDIELVEQVIKLRNNKNHWAVIDLLIKVWAKSASDEVDAFQVQVKDYKEGLVDSKYGQTKGGKDFERRFTISFPKTLMIMIRTQYKADELPMDSKFFSEFAKRYPFFKVSEKI